MAIDTVTGIKDLAAMWRIRAFEETVHRLRMDNQIVGSVHLCNGQEAVAIGGCSVLRPHDALFATYRGHGWALASGVPPHALLAELLGRSTGVNGGRGGSAHFSAPEYGFYGENSIVGAGVPIAVGAALAARYDHSNRVVMTVFGDGAINQGGVSEAMNLASAMKLPVIFVCENNRYSELTPIADMVGNPDLAARATALNIPAVHTDGNDPAQVRVAMQMALSAADAGRGPSFIEAHTQRIVGHYIGDAQQYRSAQEREADDKREPIARLSVALRSAGIGQSGVDQIEDSARHEMELAEAGALKDPIADIASVGEHLYA